MKRIIKGLLHRCGFQIIKHRDTSKILEVIDDATPQEGEIINIVKSYTMTPPEAVYGLIQAVKYVVANQIPGAIVECGVAGGGSMMAVAKTLAALKDFSRELFLFDIFYPGMPRGGEFDVDHKGNDATTFFEELGIIYDENDVKAIKEVNTLPDVRSRMNLMGYDNQKIHCIRGKVEDTIPHEGLDQICILRLDTDFYESTRHELIHLFPRLVRGGILIIDDYAAYEGARKATDEFITEHKLVLYLNRIGPNGCRFAVKI
jgi:O-methyltransferase